MPDLRVAVSDGVATVTLDRPPVNAMTSSTFREIAEVFSSFASRTDVSVAVLTGGGERAFSAGVDLKDSARRFAGPLLAHESVADQLDAGRVVRDCFSAVLESAVPVVAAVNGPAIGAGLALVACCDIIIASSNARFALTEIDVGALGGGRHLQRLVGTYKTRRMMYTGEFESAAEFYRLGILESVVDPQDLLTEAASLAGRLAAKAPHALRLAKESLNRSEFLPLMEGYRVEQDYTSRLMNLNNAGYSFARGHEPQDELPAS
jgi:enoyl-CoA hydratase